MDVTLPLSPFLVAAMPSLTHLVRALRIRFTQLQTAATVQSREASKVTKQGFEPLVWLKLPAGIEVGDEISY